MTQNNGEFADPTISTDIPGLSMTDQARNNTERLAEHLSQRPIIGAVIDESGRNLGVLAWFTDPAGDTMAANVDGGAITTDPIGRDVVVVLIQDERTGEVRSHSMPDVVAAFQTLRLTTRRCDGIRLLS